MIAHVSSSWMSSLFIKWRNSRNNYCGAFEHFWILPQTKAQTLCAKGHSHCTWLVVSCRWPQNPFLWSICTLLHYKLPLVGKMFEQALHTKFQTLGGIFSNHIFFHVCLSNYALSFHRLVVDLDAGLLGKLSSQKTCWFCFPTTLESL